MKASVVVRVARRFEGRQWLQSQGSSRPVGVDLQSSTSSLYRWVCRDVISRRQLLWVSRDFSKVGSAFIVKGQAGK